MNDNEHHDIILSVQHLFYNYAGKDKAVLDDVSFTVKKGELISILGANGSGKSTLLSCLNGNKNDYRGTIQFYLNNDKTISPKNQNDVFELRQFVGTVLQNPDDQIISSVAEEDTAFGPENLGLSEIEIKERVTESLRFMELEHKASMPPQYLSGGELQRLCIAGVLAMKPHLLFLDEASSMLDETYRAKLHSLLRKYIDEGNTVVQVIHSLEEAVHSDRCIVLSEGKKVFDDEPSKLLSSTMLSAWGFRIPESIKMIQKCNNELPDFSFPWNSIFDPSVFGNYLYDYIISHKDLQLSAADDFCFADQNRQFENASFPIVFQNAAHEYHKDSGFASVGMENINLRIPAKSKIAVIGLSGSGKSTLLKHMNALLLPTNGNVFLMEHDVFDQSISLKSLRKKIALGIQNPEAALFEREVFDDVSYGPKNNGVTGNMLQEIVASTMNLMNLPYDEYAHREINTLSGGEKRRAALAGIFALESEVIVLDEPAASLDGKNQEQVFAVLEEFRKQGKTVIFTTHSIDDVRDCDFVAVMDNGKLICVAPPRELFAFNDLEKTAAYPSPWIVQVYKQLSRRGFSGTALPLSIEEMFCAIKNHFSGINQHEENISCYNEDVASDTVKNDYTVFEKIESDIPSKKKRKKSGLEYFRSAAFGQFFNINSPLRNLRAGIKLSAVILLSVLALICPSPLVLSAGIICLLALSYPAGKIKPVYLLQGFVRAIPFVLIIVFFQFVFSMSDDTSQVFFQWRILDITKQETINSIMIVLRLFIIMILMTFYTAVTPLRETLRAVKKGLSPLGFLGFPVKDFSLSVGISLRFVPVLTNESRQVVSAQLSRGGGYEGKGRLAQGIPLIVPLFIRSLERCTKLAQAMIMRLYAVDTGGQDKVRRIAAGGMLSAVIIVLGITRLGLIPWFAGASLTIMHVPVIIGAILEGPVTGLFIGFIFGVFALIQAAISPAGPMDVLFVNPLISVLPRMCIGPAAWGLYKLFSGQIGKRKTDKKVSAIKETLGIIIGALGGSLVNTIFVLSAIAISGNIPWGMVYAVAVANGIPESIAAAIIVLMVVSAWKRIPRRRKK
jgi:energy-coupling factor transport system ATP-binding protein